MNEYLNQILGSENGIIKSNALPALN